MEVGKLIWDIDKIIVFKRLGNDDSKILNIGDICEAMLPTT